MQIEVVIAFAGGCPHRDRALQWCRGRYDWPVVVAPGRPGPWCKATAVMPAVSNSTAHVVVVAGADVWCDGIPAAIQATHDGAPWAIPHGQVHRLTLKGSEAVYSGHPWESQALEQPA